MELEAQLFEIYNENVRDLLAGGKASKSKSAQRLFMTSSSGGTGDSVKGSSPVSLKIVETPDGMTEVQGGMRIRIEEGNVKSMMIVSYGDFFVSLGRPRSLIFCIAHELTTTLHASQKTEKVTASLGNILKIGYDSRATHATNIHEHSSRSHLILTLWLTTKVKRSQMKTRYSTSEFIRLFAGRSSAVVSHSRTCRHGDCRFEQKTVVERNL